MKLSEILPSVFADGDDPDIQVTTKKYSQFPQANGPGIQGVGLKGGNNVRFDLTTDAIAVNPNITFSDGGEPLYDPDEIANITNQLEVNRFLATELSKLEFAGVEVSSDPPAITTDGQLWYDDDRLELFVSYQDAWISTSPLESRVEAGEALQAEILGRVEAGEKNQASIITAVDDGIREQTRLRSRIGDLEANSQKSSPVPLLWKYTTSVSAEQLGNGEFRLSSGLNNGSADEWTIYFAERDANGNRWFPHDGGNPYSHAVDAQFATIRSKASIICHGKTQKLYFNEGPNKHVSLKLTYYRKEAALISGKYYQINVPGYMPFFPYSDDAYNNGTHS